MKEKEPEEKSRRRNTVWQMLKRWQDLSKQLQCPNCGAGHLPESRFCLRCGAGLPEIQRGESPLITEQRAASRRALNWIVDLVPGVVSPGVCGASLAAFVVAGTGALFAFSVLSGVGSAGPFGAVLILPLFAALGFASILIYISGLSWLLYGKVCNPVEAFVDFKFKDWAVAIVMTVLAVKIAFWIM